MDQIRTALCQNEDILASFCAKQGLRYSATAKKKFFEALDHDGDLLHYITTSMSAEEMKAFADIAHSYNYKTCLDIINEYLASLKVDDYLDIDKLTKRGKYSTYQIAALAQKYNIVIGMQYVERKDKKYVIIKSTLENENSKQGYHDHWIEKGKTLCYYLQKEDPNNTKNFSFSYKPNRLIFNSIFHNSTDPLDIHVFTRKEDRAPYEYQGVYHSIAVSEDGRSFTLACVDVSPFDPSVSDVKQDFEERFERASTKTILGKKKTLEKVNPPSPSTAAAKTASTQRAISERDYIYEAKLKQKIGDIGEEAVWEYEKQKIRDALPNDKTLAESLIKQMRWVSREAGGEKYGYDINSFNIVNGKVIPIFIEVKTTTSDARSSFFISDHELETARSVAINQNYYIYRVYNINSDQPGFFVMKGDPANFVKLKPFIWLAKVR